MIKAVIFDIDGTLIDSVDLHAKAWQEALRHFGKEVPYDIVRSQIGKGGDQILPVFLSSDEAEKIEDKISKWRKDRFNKEYLQFVKPFPKVRELFQRIIQDGKKTVLASSAGARELQKFKEIARIEDLVEDETSADDAEQSKPEPDIFKAAIQKLKGITKEEMVVVGDTPYDVIAAKRAGLRTIGVLCGGFTKQSLEEAGAVEIFRDPAELLANYSNSLIGS